MVENVPSPAHSLDSLTEYRGVGYSPCVDRRGIDVTVVPHLDKLEESLSSTLFDQDNAVQDKGEGLSVDS